MGAVAACKLELGNDAPCAPEAPRPTAEPLAKQGDPVRRNRAPPVRLSVIAPLAQDSPYGIQI